MSQTPTARSGAFVHDWLTAAAGARPDARAISDPDSEWTYRELDRMSRRFAGWLAARNVGRGDRVLVRLRNRCEYAAIVYGASRRGAVVVPVDHTLKPFLLSAVVADADPAVILLEADDVDGARSAGGRPVTDVVTAWREVDATPEAAAQAGAPHPDDPCLMMYTSGSTSTPKAVVCGHAQIRFAAQAITERLEYRREDVVFVRVPFSFDYGLYQIFLATIATAAVTLPDRDRDVRLMAEIRRTRATVVPVVPSLAGTLVVLAERDPAPTDVRLFTNTGATLAPELAKRLRAAFPDARLCLMFGTTECKRIAIHAPDGDLDRPGSVGLPLAGTEVRIVDETGSAVPVGEVGEIVVGGAHVMSGYWRAPELTARRFRPDPGTGRMVLHTGDRGRLDADGYLYFVGRDDDLVKRRGTRISLLEVEAAAMTVPGVVAAAALYDQETGRLAVVVSGEAAAERAVMSALAERLDVARLPDECHVIDAFPLTANGKVDRRALAGMLR